MMSHAGLAWTTRLALQDRDGLVVGDCRRGSPRPCRASERVERHVAQHASPGRLFQRGDGAADEVCRG